MIGVKFMNKFRIIAFILIISLIFSLNIEAASDLDINFFAKLFNVERNKLDYFANFNINNDKLSSIFYLYSNADRTLTKNQFEHLMKNDYNWRELAIYFGLPPIIFEDEVIKLRRTSRSSMEVPLGEQKYQKRHKTKYIEEKINLNPGKYEYYYKNKANNIEEKITVKQNKYEYFYKSNQMEEKLTVQMVTNKYSYYYKNFNSGQTIKKEGEGKPIDSDIIYRELQEEYNKEEVQKEDNTDYGLDFNFKINLNF